MRQFRTIGLALVAGFALSAVVVSAAQAVTAPYFTIGGTRLAAGKTHNFDAKVLAGEEFVLHAPELNTTITCFSLQVVNGVLLGSNAGQPGKDDEGDVFSKCTLAGNGAPNCEVVEPITTNPLTSELVEIDRSKQVLGEEFKPTTGKTFVTLKFEGAECQKKEAQVTGEVAGEARTDGNGFGNIELGQAQEEAASWLVHFPSTPITTVLLVNTKGEKTSFTLAQLAFATVPAQLTGTALALLSNTKGEPERGALWSPLP